MKTQRSIITLVTFTTIALGLVQAEAIVVDNATSCTVSQSNYDSARSFDSLQNFGSLQAKIAFYNADDACREFIWFDVPGTSSTRNRNFNIALTATLTINNPGDEDTHGPTPPYSPDGYNLLISGDGADVTIDGRGIPGASCIFDFDSGDVKFEEMTILCRAEQVAFCGNTSDVDWADNVTLEGGCFETEEERDASVTILDDTTSDGSGDDTTDDDTSDGASDGGASDGTADGSDDGDLTGVDDDDTGPLIGGEFCTLYPERCTTGEDGAEIVIDYDGDEILNDVDECRLIPGTEEFNGCPQESTPGEKPPFTCTLATSQNARGEQFITWLASGAVKGILFSPEVKELKPAAIGLLLVHPRGTTIYRAQFRDEADKKAACAVNVIEFEVSPSEVVEEEPAETVAYVEGSGGDGDFGGCTLNLIPSSAPRSNAFFSLLLLTLPMILGGLLRRGMTSREAAASE